MFKEFSDAELVIMWHRINQSDLFYTKYINLLLDKEKIRELEVAHKSNLWKKINAECNSRNINVHTLIKTVPIGMDIE